MDSSDIILCYIVRSVVDLLLSRCRYWYKNGCLRPDLMTCFIALDPCIKENGGLQVRDTDADDVDIKK